MSAGAIKPTPTLEAPADLMAAARANCAARLRARDSAAEADAFTRGERDQSWAMRHEVAKLRAEQGRAGA
ncbi:hypothetical protein [Novosphingobium sp. NDB2Meth1]|uniref:hypothetical protein n=1 Tax=Novosphingobium sp. NDB2Meth1 TaxID=1892847 RepID=UPI000931B206|nr:hypothetical protein [Novosphingobium sp. NDB2Meth1]